MDVINNTISSTPFGNKRSMLLAILVVIILVLIGFFFLGRKSSQKSNQPAVSTLPKEVTVEVTENGFVPKKVTITAGSAVRWVNKTDEKVTVNSDDHPTHRKFKELNLGEFSKQSTLVHIFTTKGTYTYHDHFHPNRTGAVLAQ